MRRIQTPNSNIHLPNKSQNANPKKPADGIWQFVLVWGLGFGDVHSWSSRQRHGAPLLRGVFEPRASVVECGCSFCRCGSESTTDPEKRQKRQAHSKSFAISRHHR